MSKRDIPPSIKSRPVYGTLETRPGAAHLMLADAEGADAILDLAKSAAPTVEAASIIYVPASLGDARSQAMKALQPKSYREAPTIPDAVSILEAMLAGAHMGTQIYLAGTEGLIGQGMHAAMEAGIEHVAIQAEHRGSLARRVQCVHCKGITEDVTTNPVTCSHCGLLLLVRDHYSRRLAAFQGVCINAEDQTEIPETEVLYT